MEKTRTKWANLHLDCEGTITAWISLLPSWLPDVWYDDHTIGTCEDATSTAVIIHLFLFSFLFI